MIEAHDALITWRFSERAIKTLLDGKEVFARRIADHRKAYLSYEGPISCDRGMVKIMDSGECTLLNDDGEWLHYAIKGNTFRGTICIQKKKGTTHRFRYFPFL